MDSGKRRIDPFPEKESPAAAQESAIFGEITPTSAGTKRFRNLFDHNPDAVFSIDTKARMLEANHASEQITGYTRSQLIGRSFLDFVVPDQHEQVRANFAQVLMGAPQRWETTIVHRSGHLVVLDGVTLPIVIDGVVTGIYGLARDVTELRDAARELEISQARYRFVVETVGQILFQTDSDGCMTFLNPAWYEIIGHNVEDSLGKPFLSFVHPDDHDLCTQMYVPVLRGEKVWCVYEARFLTADGTPRWIEVRSRAVRSSEGATKGATGTLTDITERKHLEEQLVHQAYHDALTGLPNRILLMERLEQALLQTARTDDHIAVLFLDLDNFKVVNDSLGHDVGDQLIVAVGERIRSCLRVTDTVARIGGDEFAVLLSPVGDASAAAHAAQRIIDTFATPCILGPHEVVVAASIGIALGTMEATRVADLLRQADMAMYRAKANGRNCYEVFDMAMHAAAVARMELENDLRRAVRDGELVVYYQPELIPGTWEIAGYEALLRWNHPQKGLISPADFIPVAEETGLILPITTWLFGEVCRRAIAWSTPDGDGPLVSVNLSMRQFRQANLVDTVTGILRETGLRPDRLCLEVAEGVLIADVAATTTTLHALRDLGVQIAVDDFGTGFSSLTYLMRLPIDLVKIDRAIIHDLQAHERADTVVAAIVALVHALGARVVAEGVETATQFDLLQTMGCDFVQGFYCGRPAPL